ncbi:hypothetical protein BGZ65_002025 [Modicella reniformis]|uniref:Uncharacterized protein n=1 Tax=Modicella reniformis TaxID=1440133 RepID=A0A9P6LS98_9FUNG|nr:hypothetical protein BGZ65_002025 [Modicella reniformis]
MVFQPVRPPDSLEDIPINKGGHPAKIDNETVKFLKVYMKRGVLKTVNEADEKGERVITTTGVCVNSLGSSQNTKEKVRQTSGSQKYKE